VLQVHPIRASSAAKLGPPTAWIRRASASDEVVKLTRLSMQHTMQTQKEIALLGSGLSQHESIPTAKPAAEVLMSS
jgi:hypothetical protein